MTLQNRVLPDGEIVSQNWRGIFMGNRGGRIHDPQTKMLLKRRWASKRWIICVTEFKNRQRQVMGNSYTELFFLDEVSALACGHRPCFECRRKHANAFGKAWQTANGQIIGSLADGIDTQLHTERCSEGRTINAIELQELPDGCMVKSGDLFFVKKNNYILNWSPKGYIPAHLSNKDMTLLTPRSIINVLGAGFQPEWHPTANREPYGNS